MGPNRDPNKKCSVCNGDACFKVDLEKGKLYLCEECSRDVYEEVLGW